MTSIMATLVAAGFELKGKTSKAQAMEELDRLLQQGETPTPHPNNLATRFEARDCGGGIFYANEDTASPCTVFYLHGGAYVHDFSPFHWRFLEKLVDGTDAAVIAPAYRLIPYATWKDAYGLIIPLYKDYVEQHPEKKVALMGDSAGGGLALALAEQFKLDGIRMPDELILLSPWVDLSMDNPAIATYADEDPWLSVPWLKTCGRSWAGGTDIRDRRLSPINGDLSGIGNVTVFTGTKEVFNPDLLKLYSLLDKSNLNELVVGQSMMHVYPLMPIPEAKPACETIFRKVTR